MPTRLRYFLSLVSVLGAMICAPQLAAAAEPACSCADIHPPSVPVNATPAVETTAAGSNTASPAGANCFANSSKGPTWITVSAALQTALSPAAIIQRFGAISDLQTVQYWSTTEQAWRPLVAAAFAVRSVETNEPRADYSAAELSGSSQYYRVTDTRTYEPVNYSLQLLPAAPAQVCVQTRNVDPIRKWGITLYRPDGIHTLYFLNERSPGVWSYYSITRLVPATFLARGHEKSYINRAIALYRHYLRLPTTADPPAAR